MHCNLLYTPAYKEENLFMKKAILSAFIGLNFLGFSQIPNPGFEAVTSGVPNGWNLGVYSVYPIRDTASPHTGSHAAAIYGSVPPAYNGAVVQNFPQVSALPIALTGWYKFYPQMGDSIIVYVEIWKQGNYAGKAVSNFTASILTGTTSVYTQFNVPINYSTYTATTCDSAFISIYPTGNVASGGYNWAHPNTKAIFDDLAWTGTTTAVPEISKSNLLNVESVYPNPAKESINIIYSLSEPAIVSLKLIDMMGKEALKIVDNEKQGIGRYKAIAELSELPKGIYFYEFSTSSGFKVTKKIITQ